MTAKAKDVMVTGVVTVAPEDGMGKARSLMQAHDLHALPVVDQNRGVVGIITSTDLLSGSSELLPVSRLMTRELVSLPLEAPIEEAARLMQRHGIHHLIVAEGDKMAGMLSSLDVLRVFEKRAVTPKRRASSRKK